MPCPGGHVQVAPPGLQDRRGPQLLVAGHQWHPPGLPHVGDLGECPRHNREVGGGLPTPTGVRADRRPSPVLDEEEAAADLEVGAPLPLKDAGPGYSALRLSGYADDT